MVFGFKKAEGFDPANTDLSKFQLWCVELAGVLASLNRGKHFCLEIDEINPKNINAYKKYVLKESWDIENKDHLLETLEWLSQDGGDNQEYMTYVSLLEQNPEKTNKEIVSENKDLELDKEKMDLVRSYHFKHKNILGWDCGRYVFLCRIGYLVGFLTRDEALDCIQNAGDIVKENFASWEAFVKNYAVGRKFWAVEDDPEDAAFQYDEVIDVSKKLLSEKGAWKAIPWEWSENNQ